MVAGKTATVNIDAGIELVGRSKEDQPLSQWEVFDLKTQKPVAHVEERWGFTPLPPGRTGSACSQWVITRWKSPGARSPWTRARRPG